MAKLTLSDDTVASLRVNGAQAHTEFFDADVPGCSLMFSAVDAKPSA